MSAFAQCKRKNNERVVQNDLAVTPTQMADLASKGVPIAPQNLGLGYQEGVSSLDYQPPLEHIRGIDIAELWESREQVKDKVRNAKKAAQQQKGD